MNISFTGVKNVGAIGIDMANPEQESVLEYRCVNLQLNNQNGRDLDDFERVLRKFPNSINKDFLTITTFETKEGELCTSTPQIALNSKDLVVNDENLWVYEKLVKLLSEVSKKPSDSFETSETYLESEDCRNMLYPLNVVGLDDIDQEILMRLSHYPERVQAQVENMTKTLEQAVYDYMA